MDISITQKRWNISQKQLAIYNVEKIAEGLSAFNQMLNGQFYMVDYFHKKIIVSSPYAPILCGYPKSLIEQEGFDFYNRILKEDEWKWIEQMNTAAFKICYQHPISERLKFMATYDLTVLTQDKQELVLRHKVMPYKLCQNGNVWLGLCYVTISTSVKMKNKAYFTNVETGKRYHFVEGNFILSDVNSITSDEIQILKWMAKGFTDKQMCLMANVSINTFNARKRRLFKKLDVNVATAAMHQAHLMGLI